MGWNLIQGTSWVENVPPLRGSISISPTQALRPGLPVLRASGAPTDEKSSCVYLFSDRYCAFQNRTSCACCSRLTHVTFSPDCGSPPKTGGWTYHLILPVKRGSGLSVISSGRDNGDTYLLSSGTVGAENVFPTPSRRMKSSHPRSPTT